MHVVVLVRGPLQSHSEEVAFFVHGLSVFIRLAAAEEHWIVTQNAPWKLECTPLKPRTGLGINIVVDTGRSKRDEKQIKQLGMRYISLAWYCPLPKDDVFARFLKLIKKNPDKKIFVHCRLGNDRQEDLRALPPWQ